MKLRNKKTGEIREAETREDGIYLWDELTEHWWKYELDLLAKGWEYYIKPAKPLIKDEKIRKAVRAWAELHELENVFYFAYSIHKELSYLKSKDTGVVIDIVALPELEDGKIYTIAELCGEEEE
jgi:hypothetical protein